VRVATSSALVGHYHDCDESSGQFFEDEKDC
jgi:hypothetical protein